LKGRNPTAEEKRWMSKVAELGCIVCWNKFSFFSPAGIHHIEGKTKEGAHFKVLPLCPHHHQIGSYGVALHQGRVEWEKRYGTQAELLEQVGGILNDS
jgi:Recombination enhancement, RecA-dependent nuclease